MTGNPDKYQTVAAATKAEYVVQRSRFIGCTMPAITRDDCRAFIDSISVKHPKANHCCWAYKTGYPDAAEEYYSDAGEPSGTAGSPILSAISHAELQNVVVVVIRYFGGIKLGIRGLIDAYRTTARMTLENGTYIQRQPMTTCRVVCIYAQFEALKHLVELSGGIITSTEFKEAVTCILSISRSEWESFSTHCQAIGIEFAENC
jgi:uncharacterized YigZ family protein